MARGGGTICSLCVAAILGWKVLRDPTGQQARLHTTGDGSAMACAEVIGAVDTSSSSSFSSSSQGQPRGEKKGKIPQQKDGAKGCDCAGCSGLAGSQAEGFWQQLTPSLSTRHAAALGCDTPRHPVLGHPGRGGQPQPNPLGAEKSWGGPRAGVGGCPLALCPLPAGVAAPWTEGTPLAQPPAAAPYGQQGSAGRDRTVPYPCMEDGGVGFSPWLCRSGLVPG